MALGSNGAPAETGSTITVHALRPNVGAEVTGIDLGRPLDAAKLPPRAHPRLRLRPVAGRPQSICRHHRTAIAGEEAVIAAS